MLAGLVKVVLAVVLVVAEVVLSAVAEVVLAVLLVVAVRAVATKEKTETTLLQPHLRLRREKGLVVYH